MNMINITAVTVDECITLCNIDIIDIIIGTLSPFKNYFIDEVDLHNKIVTKRVSYVNVSSFICTACQIALVGDYLLGEAGKLVMINEL